MSHYAPRERERITCVGEGWSQLSETDEEIKGSVATSHGYVMVYANREHNMSNFTFIYKGKAYELSIEKYYTPRGLVTKAKRWANSWRFSS
jgi:hypothetical protein